MAYKLRFVQRFRQDKIREFLALEKMFVQLEQDNPAFPKGKRYLPYTGKEPSNTLIWECDFDTLAAAEQTLALILADNTHEELFQKQSEFILGTHTEIYKPYDA